MDKQEIPTTYLIIKNLGSGLTSSVKLGVDQNGYPVAIKQYKPEKSYVDLMLGQVKILKSLKHPNIVKVIDFKENAILTHRNGSAQNCWAIILEYFDGGQLWDILNYAGHFSQSVTRTYFHQIINALNHMHQQGYVHRDIKPTNILFSDRFQLKIVDFGFSCLKQGKYGTGILTQLLGTQKFLAPQILSGKYEGTKVDIFATGVTLFRMYARIAPFDFSTPNDDLYKFIVHKKYDHYWKNIQKLCPRINFSQGFKDLFVRMVAFNPNDRITIPEILNHPWTKGRVCSQDQIYQWLCQYKEIADINKQKHTKDQFKRQKQHMLGVMDIEQFSTMRGTGQLSSQLINLINQEMNNKRQLRKFQDTFKNDIVLAQADPSYAIARLKHMFKNLEIDLSSAPFQPIDYANVPRESLLHFLTIQDNNRNQIQAQFENMVEINGEDCEQKVTITVIIGKDAEQNFVFRLVQKEGDEYAFSRILNEVKNTFAYATKKINKV